MTTAPADSVLLPLKRRQARNAWAVFAAVTGLGAALAPTASAQVTVTASPSAPPQGPTGTGLNGFYYGRQPGVANTNAAVDAFIAANSPLATFTATTIDYPKGAGDTTGNTTQLSTFLGADFATFSNPALGTNPLDNHIFAFTGFINITAAMDNNLAAAGIQVLFGLGSDDGSRFRIGGQTIIDNGGNHPFTTVTQTATFSAAGLYAMDIIYYEGNVVTGIDFTAQTSPTASRVTVPTTMLFPGAVTAAPEPSAVLLAASAALLPAVALRTRRRQGQG